MVEQQFKIAEIEVAKSPTDEKILGIFRFEGAAQKKKGTKILVLAEVHSTLYSYERLLDVINATVDQTRHLIIDVEQDPVARFEKLIQRLNEAIDKFLEGEPSPISWNRINIFILELSQNHICLTGRGRLMNVFLQKQDNGSFRTFDLFGSLEQSVDVDPKKVFASLICGDIKNGDVLIAGSTNLERLRNELRIKERLTTLPPVSAALEIKQDLEHRGIPDDFIAAVVACCELEKSSAAVQTSPKHAAEKSTDSIMKLCKTEKEAEQRLAPTLGPAETGGNKMALLKHASGQLFNLLINAFKKVKQIRYRDVALLSSLRGMHAGHGSMFDDKKTKRKLIIAGACVLIVIAIFALWKRNQRLALEAATWTAAYEQAADFRNRAESDLIYGNDERAKQEIDNAINLLSSLNVKKSDNKNRVETMKGEIEKLQERLRKITVLDQVKELAALQNAASGALTAPVLDGNTAYAVDNAARTIIKIKLDDGSDRRITLPAEADPIVAASASRNSVIFTTAKGKMYGLNKDTNALTPLSFPSNNETFTDFVFYANRAYILDGTNGQVWRASNLGNGFGGAQGYIKASDVSLTGAVSLAIDGGVFVLKPEGSLSRFFSGGQESFSLNAIDPPLQAASAVWTEAEIEYLVISDPAEKRLVVFNKDGTLRAQLKSDKFSAPRDITSDEQGKNLLIVDDTRLLLVSLP